MVCLREMIRKARVDLFPGSDLAKAFETSELSTKLVYANNNIVSVI